MSIDIGSQDMERATVQLHELAELLPRSRSPPQPKTTSRRPGVTARAASSAFSSAISSSEPPSRTAYLTVNYRAVAPIERDLRVEAGVDRVEGRKKFSSGRLYDGDTLVADAEALFVVLRPGQR